MIVIPKFLLFVMTTATATAVAADSGSSSSSTLTTTLASKEDEERARTTTTPEGFNASSLSSFSSSSVVEVSGATQKITSLTGINTDGDDDSAQRKLSKSSKKVKHPKALCTLSLFADSLFMYANQCFTNIMVTISPCDDKDDMCYISEHLPSLPQEELEEQEIRRKNSVSLVVHFLQRRIFSTIRRPGIVNSCSWI